MSNFIFDYIRDLFWSIKIFSKSKNINIRICTQGLIICKINELNDLSFNVVNISPDGFLISLAGSNTENIISKIYAEKKNKFTVSFYYGDLENKNVVYQTFKAKVVLVEKDDSSEKVAFKVEKKYLSKFRKIYFSILKIHQLQPKEKLLSSGDKLHSYSKSQNNYHYSDLLTLASIEEKKEYIKERRIKLMLYVSFFLFFIVSGLISDILIKTYKEEQLKKAILKYEMETNSHVLFLIHKKHEVGLFGIPIYNYLKVHDAHKLLADLESIPKNKNLTIIIHSPGGELLAGLQIAKALKEWEGEVTVVVPYFAMSAGTLISLSADKIITRSTATFGPIDPQIPVPGEKLRTISAVSVVEAAKNRNNLSLNELNLIIESKKALNHIERFLKDIVLINYTSEQQNNIIRELLYTDRNHDFPFFAEELQRLGINITYQMPDKIKSIVKMTIS